MEPDDSHVMTPGRRRIAAVASLVLLAAAAALLALFLVENVGAMALALLGLGVASAGGWWVVTEQMPRRAVGAVAALAGLVAIGASVAVVVGTTERALPRILVVGALFAAGIGGARAAVVADLHSGQTGIIVAGGPVALRHPILICNPWSGGGKVERFGLVELARSKGVEVVMLDHGLDLEQLARDAVARGADCLAMAGGDGSQALVASIAVEHDLPFVCVSAGTRNHFALDLGLDREDPRRSLDAFDDGVERRIDYGTVGDRLFVNNVSLGVYATIVQEDAYRDAKVDTTKELLPALLGRRAEPFDLQFTDADGNEVDGAFLVQVSNNPYVIGASLDAAQRRRLDTGELGVVALSPRTGAEAAQLLLLSSVGQRSRSEHWHELTTPEFEIRSRSGTVAAGVDGEALILPTPLRFRSHPGGLRLIVPRETVAVAARRSARGIDVRHLVAIAAGRTADAS